MSTFYLADYLWIKFGRAFIAEFEQSLTTRIANILPSNLIVTTKKFARYTTDMLISYWELRSEGPAENYLIEFPLRDLGWHPDCS